MVSSTEYIREQYRLTQDSRRVLFSYCDIIRPEDFVDQNTAFGRGGSMRNLLVHIAQTYQYWVGTVALKKAFVFADYQEYSQLKEVAGLFTEVDALMDEFMTSELLADLFRNSIGYETAGARRYTSPLQLFTHVITHEYHHKGQILSISRHLGYVPVDTDIMR